MATFTPNMALILSTIGLDSGLNWETNLNSDLSILDGHNHSAGSGVPIPTAGININTNLPFQNNSATGLSSAVFNVQTSIATLNAVYVKGVDLYYNDSAGNAIQLTAGGTVNATSSGISSGTAIASFSSGVLVVNSAANTPANIQGGSLLLGNNVASSKFITLQPPAAMSANFSLTLPTLPASQKIMTVDASGVISGAYAVDGTTIAISSNTIGIPNGAIGTIQLANASVTPVKLAAFNLQRSASSGIFVGVGTGFNTVFSVTITTTGRPIMVMVQPDNSGTASSWGVQNNTNGTAVSADFKLQVNGGDITIAVVTSAVSSIISESFIPPCFSYLDNRSPGTYTYRIQAQGHSSLANAIVQNAVLVAYEIS